MKKTLAILLVSLMAGTAAWAQTSAPVATSTKVKCAVNGKVKTVKSAEVCTSMGGKVVTPKAA